MPIVSVAMPTIGGSAGRLTTDRPNTTPEAAIADSRKPAEVDRPRAGRRDVGQHAVGQPDAGQPDRHVDQEDPVPGEEGGDEAADRRADQRADQRRDGQPGHRRDQLALRRRAHQHQPGDRRHHRAAQPLRETREHEGEQRA